MTALTEAQSAPTDIVAFRESLKLLAPNARYNAILSRPDVIRVVRKLPLQDLYSTVRGVGREDATELIELMSPEQVQGFFDLDGWRRDRVDPVSMGEWLETLFASNPERAVKQLRHLDIELVSLLLKMYTEVHGIVEDEGLPSDIGLHSVTPDYKHVVVYLPERASDHVLHGVKAFIERLFGADLKFILRMIQAIRWELPSALEEEAYRWRNARLSDIGFEDITTAQRIFAYKDPDTVYAADQEEPQAPPAIESDDGVYNLSQSVLLPWSLLDEGQHIVSGALSELPETVRERTLHHAMITANRYHLAQALDVGDDEALRQTVKIVFDTLGIALAYRSRGDTEKLKHELGTLNVLDLFQMGQSLPLRAKSEFKQHLTVENNGMGGNALLRLDAPLKETVAGMLRRRPILFAGLVDEARVDYRPFQTLADVAEATRALSEAAFVSAAFYRVLGVDDVAVEVHSKDEADAPTLGSIVAAHLVRALADAQAPRGCDPVSIDVLRQVMQGGALMDDAVVQSARLALSDAIAEVAPLPGAPDADTARARAQSYLGRVLRAMREELTPIAPDDLDAKLLRSVWCTTP